MLPSGLFISIFFREAQKFGRGAPAGPRPIRYKRNYMSTPPNSEIVTAKSPARDYSSASFCFMKLSALLKAFLL
jgi:hypothetical protein